MGTGTSLATDKPPAVVTAAVMANAVYTAPTSIDPIPLASVANAAFTKTIELERNLVGNSGNIKVAWYLKDKTLFIAYSGTRDLEFWLYNYDTDVKNKYGVKLHEGFLKLAEEVHQQIKHLLFEASWVRDPGKVNRVIHCGHSAGGAVAGIMPILNFLSPGKNQIIIDFGTPRYLSSCNNKYPFFRIRFQEYYDLVPCAPLKWRGPLPGFCHHGYPIYSTPNHKLKTEKPSRWLRPLKMAYKYGAALARQRPLTEVFKHHSMDDYAASVVTHFSS